MLHIQYPYYQLFHSIQEQKEESLSSELLENWVKENPEEIRWIKKLSSYSQEDWQNSSSDERCKIYALGRINELALFKLDQLKSSDSFTSSFETYLHFFEKLGLEIKKTNNFHPFFHEIVEAEESQIHREITLKAVHYPILMIGNLLFSRARVSVLLPKGKYNLDCIKNSTLFWAYRRMNRKTEDLSSGWGSNSQWRTEMRIDLETEKQYFYNLKGGNIDLNKEEGNHIQSLIDFLKFRHIIFPMDEEEYFIYEYRYEENK